MPVADLFRASLCGAADVGTQPCPLQALLDLLTEPVAILDAERRLVYANAAFTRLGGGLSMVGKRPGESLACIHAREQPAGCGSTAYCRVCEIFDALQCCQKGETAVRDCSLVCQGGDSLEVEVHAAPLQVGDRTLSVLTLIDRTAERRRKVLERIFLHDVLNTLGSLSGFTELLRAEHGEGAAEYLEIIDNLSHEVREEIQAHRDLAEAESRELQLRPTVFDARDLIEQTARNCSARGHRRRAVRVSSTAEHALLCTDVRLLRRVLTNMVTNAIEATSEGDVIDVDCRAEGSAVRFSVHNPGAIARDVRLKIFKRSFSTKAGGHGLGTYSIRLFGEKWLGGKVGFSSSETEGTTFHVTVPNLPETEDHPREDIRVAAV